MKRYAEVIHLRPEHEAAYIRHHAQVWPEVLKTIEACNIRNYSIFLRKGTLFAYFEYHGTDYAADMRQMAACPHTQRWWSIMDPMQRIFADAEPHEKWSQMDEVFHFDPIP